MLTPVDIQNKNFSKTFRGFDEEEVNTFLDQVIKDFETVLRENKDLEGKVNNLQERITHFSNIEDTINKSILIAQETAEDVKGNATKEAKLIIREAEKNADRIVNEALAKSRKVAMELEDLKKQSKVYRSRFKMLIEAQLEMISSGDWESLMELDTNITDEFSKEDY